MTETNAMTGKVSRINKGFGFIEGDDGRDYFFHWKNVDRFSRQFRAMKIGDKVQFVKATDPEDLKKGPKALEVYCLEEFAAAPGPAAV